VNARIPCAALAVVAVLALSVVVARSDEPQPSPEEMMKKWQDANRTGKHHQALAYFLGKWDASLQFVMPGSPPSAPEKGEAEGAWLVPGRWMAFHVKATFMGRPYEGHGIHGFDNTKKKHVSTWVDNTNTAMIATEGVVVDPTGDVVVQYGTLDEFLTGEHDKAIRVVTRRLGPDKFTQEIWDLGIGESGAVVLTYTFTRWK
jgi:hypothetical protein